VGRLRDGIGRGKARIKFCHGFYTLAVKDVEL
jgi:hypothetical protein